MNGTNGQRHQNVKIELKNWFAELSLMRTRQFEIIVEELRLDWSVYSWGRWEIGTLYARNPIIASHKIHRLQIKKICGQNNDSLSPVYDIQ